MLLEGVLDQLFRLAFRDGQRDHAIRRGLTGGRDQVRQYHLEFRDQWRFRGRLSARGESRGEALGAIAGEAPRVA